MPCLHARRLAMLLAATFLASGAPAMSPLLREIEDSFVRLHEEVRPCVVSIETRSAAKGDERLEGLFRLFGQPNPDNPDAPPNPVQMPPPRAYATGSGFIYDKAGHIVTNNHVVESADSIKVKLWDGKEYDGTVVGRDPETDLAVLQITAAEQDLPVAKLGDSDKLKVGQFAIAMGSPRGFEGSLTFGHISALGREGLQDLAAQGLRFQNLVQTDAGINLGNSGGPLCNIDGEVVGINVAIVFGSDSLGFAIPINMAKNIVPQLLKEGRVTRGFLGVRIENADKGLGESVGLPDTKGAFITHVQPGTPAEQAGLKRYDVIRKVNGESVADASDLVRRVSAQQPGALVMLEIWREQKPAELQVKLDLWKADGSPRAGAEPVQGMRLQELTPGLRARMGLQASQAGVVVGDVAPGSPAEDAGMLQGDVIIEVAQQPVGSIEQLRQVFKEKGVPGASLLLGFIRGDDDPNIAVLRVPKQ